MIKKQLIKITSKPIVQIPFWVDSKKFYEIKEKNILRSKYGFKENDYIVGSFQRDTEGHDLKSPKLSKGPDLFINNLIKLKKDNGLDLDSSICIDFEKNLRNRNYLFSNGIDLIHEFFNFERKLDTDLISKSVKLLGKNSYLNKIFTQIADKGIKI